MLRFEGSSDFSSEWRIFVLDLLVLRLLVVDGGFQVCCGGDVYLEVHVGGEAWRPSSRVLMVCNLSDFASNRLMFDILTIRLSSPLYLWYDQ